MLPRIRAVAVELSCVCCVLAVWGFPQQTPGAQETARPGAATAQVEPKGVIEGKVVNAVTGEPLKKATLMLAGGGSATPRQFSPASLAPTNDMGEYRISNLKAGKYIIAAVYRNMAAIMGGGSEKVTSDKPEMAYITTYYPTVGDPAEASPLEVGVGTEAGGTNIQMMKATTFRVRGKVVEPFQGKIVMVALTPKGATLLNMISRPMTVVQGDGSFEIKGVVPGSYSLSAMATDLSGLGAAVPVEVTDKHVEGVLLQTGSGADLPVTLSVEGHCQMDLKNVRIALQAADGLTLLPKTASMEEGKLMVKSLAPGRYKITVSNLPENCYVKSVRLGVTEASEDRVIDVSGGAAGTLHIVLSPNGAQVEGTIRGEDGNPLPGATVALIPESRRPPLYQSQTTDARGGFNFKGVPPGDYKVLAWEDVESGAYQDPELVKKFDSNAQPLSLKENDRQGASLKAIPFEKTKTGQ